jgi:hypothetical protein
MSGCPLPPVECDAEVWSYNSGESTPEPTPCTIQSRGDRLVPCTKMNTPVPKKSSKTMPKPQKEKKEKKSKQDKKDSSGNTKVPPKSDKDKKDKHDKKKEKEKRNKKGSA